MKDFLLDSNNNLKIADGDFVTGVSDDQQKKLLLMTEKGSFKEFPDTGVGLFSFIESEDQGKMLAEIKRQYAADGLKIETMGFNEKGQLLIDAEY